LEKLKTISVILLLVGIISLIYGWFLGSNFSADSNVYERLYTIMIIKKYVFLAFGCIIILISFITDIVGKELPIMEDLIKFKAHYQFEENKIILNYRVDNDSSKEIKKIRVNLPIFSKLVGLKNNEIELIGEIYKISYYGIDLKLIENITEIRDEMCTGHGSYSTLIELEKLVNKENKIMFSVEIDLQ